MIISGIRIVRSIFHTRSRRLYLMHRESARTLIVERIRYFNTYYSLPLGKIAIRNQKSRWGSCSKKGNLNFNYKLVFLPPEIRDYVIVHEICHVKEFNHSKNFWNLVEQTVPNRLEIRRKLRKMGINQ
jgi:predicted metal-dependent hydrolase